MVALYKLATIPGTLFCGWVSDKLFKENRGLTGLIFMIAVTIAVYFYWQAGSQNMAMAMMVVVGFLIYGPVMMIGLYALEFALKKQLVRQRVLLAYLGGSVAASAIIGRAVESYGWDQGF